MYVSATNAGNVLREDRLRTERQVHAFGRRAAGMIVLGLHQLIEFHIQIQRARIASLVPWLVIMHWLQINAHWWLSSAD